MIYATFTEPMRQILSDMKGKDCLAYECEETLAPRQAFGNLRLYVGNYAVEIKNEEQPFPFFNGTEDMSCFSCELADPASAFNPYVEAGCQKIEVGGRIEGIELISDEISVNHGEYTIRFDQAVVLHCKEKTLMLARDVWFSELIGISNHDDYDAVFPIEQAKAAWSNDGTYDVEIKRTRQAL